MIEHVFSFVFFIAASSLLMLAARSDWRNLTIPNEYSLALIGLFVLGAILPNALFPGVKLVPGLIGGGIVFGLTMILYSLKAMGGGDTKLAGAAGLLIGVGHIALFLLVMTLTGGLLGLYAFMTRKYPEKLLPSVPDRGSWLDALKQGQNKVPYGIAIATGAIVTLGVKWLSTAQ